MSDIRYIAFDLGRVIVDWNPDYLFSKIIPDTGRRNYLLEHVVTLDWIEEVDRGKLLRDAVEERINLFPDYEYELREYGKRWIETIPNLIDETVEIKKQLKNAGYPIYALSNFGRDTYQDALKIYPELGEFDGAVISGHEGYIKPEREIYEILLDRYKLTPEHLIFIDDREDNIDMAKFLGINGIVFTSPQDLKNQLIDFKLNLKTT